MDAGQDGIFTFRFSNLDNADDVTVRFADEMDSGKYYRFHFNGGTIELAYDDGIQSGSISLPTSTTKNNNTLRLERCGGQILWREQGDVLRLNSGNDGMPLIAVVEPTATTTNVQLSVEFEPNTTICDKCALAGGTSLYPGDLMFVGYDNTISAVLEETTNGTSINSANRIAVRPQVPLTSGTSFLLSEAVYQSGSTWVAGDSGTSGYAPQNIASQRITYTGSRTIGVGEVVCFELPLLSLGDFLATGFHIDGSPSSDFCVVNAGNTPDAKINIAASGSTPTALFLQQGDWKFTDTHGEFCGRTLSGLQYGGTWGSGNASNVPDDIMCIEIQASTSTSEENALLTTLISNSATYQNQLATIIDFSGDWTVDNTADSDPLCGNAMQPLLTDNMSQLSDLHVYPNPFSETVWVEFDLEKSQTVDLSLVDMNGRLVYQSVRTNILAAGHHQLELTPNLLSNRMGLLMLRIITPTGVTVRRVLYKTSVEEGEPAIIFGRG